MSENLETPLEENKKIEENSLESLLENVDKEEKKEVLSINITSLDDISKMLINNDYDYVTIEPIGDNVVVKFMSEEKIADEKTISYPLYSNILIQSKTRTGLKADNSVPQEGDSEYKFDNKDYRLFTKTFPGNLGEKLMIKLDESTSKKSGTSVVQIFAFIGALIFIGLILGGAFITFTVMNAKTVEDVMFFRSLGINLNDVNAFLARLVTLIFSAVVFGEIIIFATFGIKFLLSKKVFKRRRILFGLLASATLFMTFVTGSVWMYTVKKVNALPNWQEMSYGDVQLYDNTKLLLTGKFDKASSLITDYSNLIGPVTIKFDLTYFKKKEEDKARKILKYIWSFGDGRTSEELSPITIKEFKDKGTYNITLMIEEKQADGKILTKPVENIPSISINNVVKISQKQTNSGGNKVTFDATDLNELGKVEWYMGTTDEDFAKPKLVGNIFTPGKVIFGDTMVGLYIRKDGKLDESLDKVFLVSGQTESTINGEILATKVDGEELSYDFSIKNPQASVGDGFIEEYKWQFGDTEKILKAEAGKEELSSKIRYDFVEYGNHDVKVTIKTTSGKTKEITLKLNLIRELKIKSPLQFTSDDILVEDVRYEGARNEYYLQDFQVPTTLKIDARLLKLENPVYSMQQVKWDTNNDGIYDEKGKTVSLKLLSEGKKTIGVEYAFRNAKTSLLDEKITEKIYIDSIRKEAIVDLEMIKDNDYAPVTVKFDASKSEVTGDNIVKFIYNYGDGESEERDALNLGHLYLEAGEYNVGLTIVTESGRKFSITKKLILKPKPQSAKLKASLKRVKTYQGIDFSSSDSEGQITSYFWDFGDGEISTDANPTHFFKNSGEFTVKLKANFENKNTLEDTVKIEVIE